MDELMKFLDCKTIRSERVAICQDYLQRTYTYNLSQARDRLMRLRGNGKPHDQTELMVKALEAATKGE